MTQLPDSKRLQSLVVQINGLQDALARKERKLQKVTEEKERLKEDLQTMRELRAKGREKQNSAASHLLKRADGAALSTVDWHWHPVAAILKVYKKPLSKKLIIGIHAKARFPLRPSTKRPNAILNALTHLRRNNKVQYDETQKTWALTPLGKAVKIPQEVMDQVPLG